MASITPKTSEQIELGERKTRGMESSTLDERSGSIAELLAENFNDWSESVWRKRRMLYRLSVLCITCVIIIVSVAVGHAVADGTHSEYNLSVDLTTSVTKIEFDFDHCTVFMQGVATNGATSTNAKMTIDVHTHHDADNVRITGPVIAGDVMKFSVIDGSPLGERYAEYECRVYIRVGNAFTLPDTYINIRGYEYSSVETDSMNWDMNKVSVRVEHPHHTSFFGKFIGGFIGNMDVNINRGVVYVDRPTINGDAQQWSVTLNQEDANFFMRTSGRSINTFPQASPSSLKLCLTGALSNAHPSMCDNNNAPTNCTLRNSAIDTEYFRLIPTVAIKGLGYAHVYAASQDVAINNTISVPTTTDVNPTTFTSLSLGLSTFDQENLRAAFGADLARVYVQGPGAPNVIWQGSKTKFFLLIPRRFLDVFSWTLLSPSTNDVNVTLQPGFCPGMHETFVNDISNPKYILMVRQLLKDTLGGLYDNVIFSKPENRNAYNSDKFEVLDGAFVGEVAIRSTNLDDEWKIMAILVTNIIVSVLSSLYVIYLLVFRVKRWAHNVFSEWGMAKYGDTWTHEKQKELLDHANIFFWSEFLVGMPIKNITYVRLTIVVWVNMIVVVLPIIPLAVLLDIYLDTGLDTHGDGTSTFDVLAYLIFTLVLICLVVGTASLITTYMELHTNIYVKSMNQYVYYPIYILTSFFSIAYVVNAVFWILLGITVKPNRILPIAAVVVVVVVHAGSSVYRIYSLYALIRKDISQGKDPANVIVDKNLSSPDEIAVDVRGFSAKSIISAVEKSKIFEIAGKSLYTKLWEEVMIFLITTTLLCFLGLGFFVFSTSTNYVSSITSAIVLLIGGGVNIPLNSRKRAEHASFREAVMDEKKAQ